MPSAFTAVPFDVERAERTLGDLRQRAEGLDDPALQADLKGLLDHDTPKALMAVAFSNSAFLARTALREAAFLPRLFKVPPDVLLGRLLDQVRAETRSAASQADAMHVLRTAKARAALLIAFADLAGVWSVADVTDALTRFADACLSGCVGWYLTDAAAKDKFQLADPERPERNCGIAVIAMGKYGAGELNYSSDIDITVFFERGRVPVGDGLEVQQFCIKLTRALVKMMQEPTADGYVFRTDLRLRPDAGATAVALSMDAAEQYYESLGQNWERAAMIKARAAAGDVEAGKAFLGRLAPFIWRKYLDYAAIEDIHSIKRQIHRHGGHRSIGLAGHNIKLGLGGIREIEFFVQTQQLILGGRFPELRNPTTCGGLDDLAAHGMIDPDTAAELKDSYAFLRMVEHRLQMREDAQTQEIPQAPDEIENVARFCGFGTTEAFSDVLLRHLRRVNQHYSELFAREDSLSSEHGNLVFTGVDDDPDTLAALSALGFERPAQAAETVRRWHFGRLRATRSERARELLTKLVPVILDAIGKTAAPDVTLVRFDAFLSGLPAGVQLFSLFASHPEFLSLLTDALGMAPRLGPYLAKNAGVLDAMLDTEFMQSLPERAALREELDGQLSGLDAYELKLDQARRWHKDHAFRIGLQVLRGAVGADKAGPAYADLADVAIAGMDSLARGEIVEAHGAIAGGNFAVLGFGKLGGRELTATSDVDLVFVYDVPEGAEKSDGARPISPFRYYTRYAQRLISALSSPTAEGVLYEVDMQLRPSGKAGPIATQYSTFTRYFEKEAWTWEKMALTRARIIGGSEDLTAKLQPYIRDVLCQPRELAAVARDVDDMRQRMAREKGSDEIWDLKQVRGGLVDLEFICQFLQLAHGSQIPEALHPNTLQCLRAMTDKGVLDTALGGALIEAGEVLHNLTQVTRIAIEGRFDPKDAVESLRALLARSCNAPTFADLEDRLRESQSRILAAYDRLIVQAM